MPRSRSRSFKALAALGGILITLILVEVAFRVVGAVVVRAKVHAVKPDDVGNPLALRDRLDQLPVDPGAIRIAFLGDSFTYGLGVKDEETFVRQAGTLRAARCPIRCTVINLARDGADPIQEWGMYNRARDIVRPDIVVQVLAENDLDFHVYKKFERIGRLITDRTWLSRYSRLVEYVEGTVRLWMAIKPSDDYMLGGSTPEERELSWRIATHEIEATKRLVEEGGAVYALIRFPYLRDIGNKTYRLEEVHRRTREIADRLGIPYLDLLGAYHGRNGNDLCLLSYDDHPNPQAHAIAAEAVADFLMRSVLPRLASRPSTAKTPARTAEQIRDIEIRHNQRILEIDPNCFSAQLNLQHLMKSAKTP